MGSRGKHLIGALAINARTADCVAGALDVVHGACATYFPSGKSDSDDCTESISKVRWIFSIFCSKKHPKFISQDFRAHVSLKYFLHGSQSKVLTDWNSLAW